ncbi:hypothetical protein G6011_06897 [Alternaria panax]|uniref:Uncharacterized protein n=1 Tax=Alternaria panax TaxID=48097 RepID=A0AAD4FA16_9PLEO|nr:hypothetical protein G6011_06897 [Alternaria panax]
MSPRTSSLQGADPPTSGNIIRVALAIESVITVGAGIYFLLFPRHYLSRAMGAAAAQVTITALQITQQCGAANIFVGAGVGLYISNSRAAIESRKTLYRFILGWELLFLPLLAWQGLMMEGGMPRSSLLGAIGQFVPFVAWRTFTLCCKPEWFGEYQERKKVE